MTLRIDPPAASDPLMWTWGEAVPGIGPAAAKFSGAVYERSTLSLREFESARITIARINHCVLCLDWRTERGGETLDESFYAGDGLSEREQMAAEYARRFAVDHLSLDGDEAFWTRFRAAYTDAEVVELSLCVGSWIAFGRLNHVLGLDVACAIPAH
jgi:alkylhydroperoxidase family enzyme